MILFDMCYYSKPKKNNWYFIRAMLLDAVPDVLPITRQILFGMLKWDYSCLGFKLLELALQNMCNSTHYFNSTDFLFIPFESIDIWRNQLQVSYNIKCFEIVKVIPQ